MPSQVLHKHVSIPNVDFPKLTIHQLSFKLIHILTLTHKTHITIS